jgi:hypothetical protein
MLYDLSHRPIGLELSACVTEKAAKVDKIDELKDAEEL